VHPAGWIHAGPGHVWDPGLFGMRPARRGHVCRALMWREVASTPGMTPPGCTPACIFVHTCQFPFTLHGVKSDAYEMFLDSRQNQGPSGANAMACPDSALGGSLSGPLCGLLRTLEHPEEFPRRAWEQSTINPLKNSSGSTNHPVS
jgi:hypothetical protein